MSTTSWDDVTLVQTGAGKAELHSESGAAPPPNWTKPPVLKAGQFTKNDVKEGRIGRVRMKDGSEQYFVGELLITALKNGGKLVDDPTYNVSDFFMHIIERSLSVKMTLGGAVRVPLLDFKA